MAVDWIDQPKSRHPRLVRPDRAPANGRTIVDDFDGARVHRLSDAGRKLNPLDITDLNTAVVSFLKKVADS